MSAKAQLPKSGTLLSDISGFPKPALVKLEKLWITTVEELIGVTETNSGQKNLAQYLQLDEKALAKIIEIIRPHLPRLDSTDAKRLESAKSAAFNISGALAPSKALMRSRLKLEAYRATEHLATLPDSVDWRNSMTPIRNQGQRGTCVAFSVVSLREFLVVRKEDGQEQCDLSEQFLYWACKERDGYNGSGTWIHVAMRCLLEIGVCIESDWPYNPRPIQGNEGQGPPPNDALEHAHLFKTTSTININPRSTVDLKTCLADGKVVAFAIPVFDSWYSSAAVRRYGNIPMPFPVTGHRRWNADHSPHPA